MAEQTRRDIPGRAGEIVAALGSDVVVCDLYDDIGAQVYHDLAGRGTQEVRELLAQVRRMPGAVLDLAAGSGRLTLPLLAAGRKVTALELSSSMLRLLEQRLAQAPEAIRNRCSVVQADMSAFTLDARFGTIVLGTTSISLLDATGRAGLYRCVRHHLSPGGRFLLSTVDRDDAAAGPDEMVLDVQTESGNTYRLFEHWPPAAPVRTVTIFPIHGDVPPRNSWTGDRAAVEDVPPSRARVPVCTTTIGVLPVPLLEAELTSAGFGVRAQHRLEPAGHRHVDVLLETEVVT